jgi:hypothetical protein
LFEYASQNLAVLNLFIRDPYYTKYLKSEQVNILCISVSPEKFSEFFKSFFLTTTLYPGGIQSHDP